MEARVASATRSVVYRADVVGSLLRPPGSECCSRGSQARPTQRSGRSHGYSVGDRQIAFGLAILVVVAGYGRDVRLRDRV